MVRKGLLTILVSFFSLFTISCTFNPLSKHNELTGTAAGTAIGAGIGAGAMHLLDAPRALMVAAGLGGAGIGYYVSSLRFASGGIVQAGGVVYTLGDYVMIEIPSDKIFDINSNEIEPEAEFILNSAIAVLNRYPGHNILISGNTSGFGGTKYEVQLSENRARQVAAYFWGHGINGFKDNGQSFKLRKLIYSGYGNYFPIANSVTAKGVRQNSRIQITAFPSSTDLHLDKRHKIFANIGGQDQPALTAEQPPHDFNQDFPLGDNIPDGYSGPRYDDTPPVKDYIHEHPSAKDTTFPTNYNTVESSPHTNDGGNVIKQGGSKGEGLKGEGGL